VSGYDFHPEARFDLDEIWEFIRVDNLAAADRVIAEILAAIDALAPFPIKAASAQILPHDPCASFWCANTSLHMRRTKNRFGFLR
jgi:plasmid stabilization system protein ParE